MARTLVTFVLDETGSMSGIKDDTIGGFNEYLRTLREGETADDIRFTFVKFDSNKIDKVCVDRPIGDVEELNANTYRPGAATPLIDAAVKSIKATREKAGPDDKVIVVIQTDGHENASVEYKREDLVALVKELTEAGWAFVFLGAGIDAFTAGADYGFAAAQTMTYDRHTTQHAFQGAAGVTQSYATTGVARGFSDAERISTGGHMPEAPKGEPMRKTIERAFDHHEAASKRISRDASRPRRKPIVDDFTL